MKDTPKATWSAKGKGFAFRRRIGPSHLGQFSSESLEEVMKSY